MEKSEYTTVPILVGFDHNNPIGEIRILTSMLPSNANFVFSIGIKLLEQTGLSTFDVLRLDDIGPYELMCVSPVSDDDYIGYLQKAGKLPK